MPFFGRVAPLAALLLRVALLLPWGLPAVATAQSHAWTGSVSNDWNTPGNWSPAGVPNNNSASATFGPAARTAIVISGVTSLSVGQLTFAANAPAYTISIQGASSAAANVELYAGLSNLSTTTRPTFITNAYGELTLGNGDFNAMSVDNSGGIGLLTAGDNVSLSGSSIHNRAGGLAFFEIGSMPSADSSSLLNDAGASLDISGDFSAAGAALGALNGAGAVLLGGNSLSLGGLNGDDTVSGVIADGGLAGGSGGTLHKTGSGRLLLSAANTYTGQTTIEAGTLQVEGSLASSSVLIRAGATLSGAGSVGNVTAQSGALLAPGNSTPDTTLHLARLICAGTANVQARIGDNGSSTYGTYLSFSSPLQSGFCPHLHFRFSNAGLPLQAGQAYLLALIQGATDYSTANLDADFSGLRGYTQASGTFQVSSIGTLAMIYFHLDDPGNRIFADGFEVAN